MLDLKAQFNLLNNNTYTKLMVAYDVPCDNVSQIYNLVETNQAMPLKEWTQGR